MNHWFCARPKGELFLHDDFENRVYPERTRGLTKRAGVCDNRQSTIVVAQRTDDCFLRVNPVRFPRVTGYPDGFDHVLDLLRRRRGPFGDREGDRKIKDHAQGADPLR